MNPSASYVCFFKANLLDLKILALSVAIEVRFAFQSPAISATSIMLLGLIRWEWYLYALAGSACLVLISH